MIYIVHFFSAWMHFMAPMAFFRVKTLPRQQVIFTVIMGTVAIISREMYRFIHLPLGAHTIIYIVVELLLMKKLIPSLRWYRVVLFVWLNVLIVITTEGLVLFPFIKHYGLTMDQTETDPLLTLLFAGIGSNLGLIIMGILGKLKGNRAYERYKK